MSPGTPQQNSAVNWGFITLYSQMRVMMAQAGKYENLKTGLWPKCAATATKLENIMVNPHEEKCAHEKFYGKIPYYAKYSRTLGEMGVVRNIATIKENCKIEERRACSQVIYKVILAVHTAC